MGFDATWWLAAGIVLYSTLVAVVAAVGDSVHARWRSRRSTVPAFAAAAGMTAPAVPPGPALSAEPVSPTAPPPARVVGRAAVGPAPALAASGAPGAGSVEIRVLGPFEVRGAAQSGAGALPAELAALVALAAMQPAGVPAAVVQELLPAPGAVAAAADRLRNWLGVDAAGRPLLADQAGVWHLAPPVRVDWHLFRTLVVTAGPEGEPEQVARALAMIRGELFAGLTLPPVAHRVLRPVVADVRAVAVRAVRGEVEAGLRAADSDRAERALRQGLSLLPREEALWLLRLEL